MNIFNLTRYYWDYSFNNPSVLKPNHTAIYFFAIEHCNRLGWKEKFGLPTSMVMEAINIKSVKTYKSCFDDLCYLGFFKVIELSKNQYTANVIALVENAKANTKALDKAIMNHRDKQSESMGISKCPIDKPITIELLKPLTEKQKEIVYDVSKKFNINEMTPNFRLISEFVRNCKNLDEFVIQNKYYHLYKEQNNEIKHGIKSYLGDGEWKAYNWESKYNSIAKKESKNSHLFRA